ncbi:uncharacterized protein LOC106172132 [Lingula anatina]|uniref:Uncharacterized protein LOC106172132 n=1 Tax=Lingula anatina TaxID=7574 RepID=A0A1S3JE70_LINAN|nr:uncharacterized protein LOC106172132 [Lingula anatina]|eukprot:XP_013408184.1 uncharacterized protein LOC106172132 [Lingula anatina]
MRSINSRPVSLKSSLILTPPTYVLFLMLYVSCDLRDNGGTAAETPRRHSESSFRSDQYAHLIALACQGLCYECYMHGIYNLTHCTTTCKTWAGISFDGFDTFAVDVTKHCSA